LVALPKNCCPRILGSVVIQLYAGECSVDRALELQQRTQVDKYINLNQIAHLGSPPELPPPTQKSKQPTAENVAALSAASSSRLRK